MQYFYYHLWKSMEKIRPDRADEANRLLIVPQFSLIVSILFLIELYFKIPIKDYLFSTPVDWIIPLGIPMLIIGILNHFFLLKRSEKIEEKFKNETKTQFVIGVIITLLLLLGLALSPVFILSLLK